MMRQEYRDIHLDALLEERDNLKIQVNLLEDTENPGSSGGSLTGTRAKLAQLEQQIEEHRRASRKEASR